MNLKHILVVGGGTAGWMTANLLQYKWSRKFDIKISVVESTKIGTVGVGEGTTPRVKDFFDGIGISESEWMPACNATYKCGVDFPGWRHDEGNNSYFHPFFSAIDKNNVPAFINSCFERKKGKDLSAHPDSFFVATNLFKQQKSPLAPLSIKEKNYYGYHFDAGLLGNYLRELAVKRGVTLIDDQIIGVEKSIDGSIKNVMTENNGAIEADFFIDCTGFKGLLIQKELGEVNISCREYLLNDSAIAIPTVQPDNCKINSHTESKALKYGWTWKIPLINRIGNGYVFSSRHVSKEDAEKEFREELGVGSEIQALHLKWEPGRIENHWVRNCLAVGLSQGFLEPLEAPMLNITQFTIDYFMAVIEKNGLDDRCKEGFNRKINSLIDSTRDYLQLHYLLNNREDTGYWADCRNNPNISDDLKKLISAWDSNGVFHDVAYEQLRSSSYGITSWYCIFSGMERFGKPNQAASNAEMERNHTANQGALDIADKFKDHKEELMEIYQINKGPN